jgi:hypothetical protein
MRAELEGEEGTEIEGEEGAELETDSNTQDEQRKTAML